MTRLPKKQERQALLKSVLQDISDQTGCMYGLEYRFHPTRKWRFDAAFPSAKVALEIEGGVWQYGRHNRALGFLNDMEKYNEAATLGWRIIRTPWEWLEDGSIVPIVIEALLHNRKAMESEES